MDKILALLKKYKATEEEIEEAKAELEETVAAETKGLKEKNSELIGRVKKLREGKPDSSAELEAAEKKNDELQEALRVATRDKEKAIREKERTEKELSEKLSSETTAVNRMVVDSGLQANLVKLGVKKEAMATVAGALRQKVTVRVDGDNRIAEIDGKPLADYLEKVWAVSDEGKFFIPAPGSAGSGAPPAGGAAGGAGNKPAPMKRADFDALDATAQMKYIKDGGKPTD